VIVFRQQAELSPLKLRASDKTSSGAAFAFAPCTLSWRKPILTAGSASRMFRVPKLRLPAPDPALGVKNWSYGQTVTREFLSQQFERNLLCVDFVLVYRGAPCCFCR